MAAAILITGATGLIGRWALRAWTGAPPLAVTHERVDLLGPGAAAKLLDAEQPDTVVHLAWSASGVPGYRNSDANRLWLEASLDLACECRERGITLFCTGTVVDDSPAPADQYTQAKADLRKALAADIAAGRVCWLRPHYVFDPDCGRPAVVTQALAAAAGSRPVSLATPDAEHDFVHAADVGGAVAHAVRHGLRGLVEIGSGRTRRVSQLVEALGVAWTSSQSTSTEPSTPPASIHALTATGWSASLTEEFFAHV